MTPLAMAAAITLATLDGGSIRVEPPESEATAIVFVSTVCPVSNDYVDRYIGLFEAYGHRGVRFLLVYSNKTESVADIRKHVSEGRFPFPVYRDPGNVVADLYAAAVTPTVVLVDRAGRERYRGKIDNAVHPARVTERYLEDAIQAVLAGKPVPRARTEAYG